MGKDIRIRLKELREKNGKSKVDAARELGINYSTYCNYESGIREPNSELLKSIAKHYGVSVDYILGLSEDSIETITEYVDFNIIGSIAAGYGALAAQDYTGEIESIPVSMLRGRSKDDYYVLRVKGDSMYPSFINGDRVLVNRCSSVDSGTVAVVLYDGEEATLKKVVYEQGEDWMELVPINPEYKTKRIEKRRFGILQGTGESHQAHKGYLKGISLILNIAIKQPIGLFF